MSTYYNFLHAAFPWVIMGLLLVIYFGVRAQKKKEDKNSENYGLIGMCMGMCIGVSLQGIIGSLGISILLGMLAGLVIGSLIEKKD